MRPVTKPNPPPNYPYVNAGTLNVNVPAFGAGAMLVVYNQFGAFARTIAWVQNQLLQKTVHGQAFPNPSTPQNRARAINAMRGRLEAIYGTARGDLNTGIGNYCSFCELPLAGHLLAVEHRAAKAEYPTYTVLWSNFLLACRDCNSFKGNRPGRAQTTAWAIASGHAVPTEANLVQEVEAKYYWADLDTGTYRRIDREFYRETHAAVEIQMNAHNYSSHRNQLRSAAGGVVRADVRSNGGVMLNNRYVEVRIANNGGGAFANRTIALLGLDEQENGRSQERTCAWLLACTELDNIVTTVAAVPAAVAGLRATVFNGMWSSLLRLAVRTGFYSVWVTVLLGNNFPAGVPAGGFANLGERFIWDTDPANNANLLQVFPGVDVTHVP